MEEQNNVNFITQIQNIDMSKIGDYKIEISADKIVYESVLHIADTVAPKVAVKNVEIYTMDSVQIEDFIVSAEDVTMLSYEYAEPPDITKVGSQQLTIIVTDEGGNIIEKDVILTVYQDEEAPVIKGAKDISVYIGDEVNYKEGVYVTDNCDKDISFSVDSSNVNLDEEGEYQVTYSAKDRSGNETSQIITVTVQQWVDITDEESEIIKAKIAELKTLYPDGKYWNYGKVTSVPCNHNVSESTCNVYNGMTNNMFSYSECKQCLAFASMVSDYVFGDSAHVYKVTDFDKVRLGDQIRTNNNSHSCFIIEKGRDYVIVAECNADYLTCIIQWGRKITKDELVEKNSWYISRY